MKFPVLHHLNIDQADSLFNAQTVWLDLEIDPNTNQLLKGGLLCVIDQQFYHTTFEKTHIKRVIKILDHSKWIAGHNIIHFDLKWLNEQSFSLLRTPIGKNKAIDTLLLSNLIFPSKPSQALLKLYKAKIPDNDPVYDCLESYFLYQTILNHWQHQVHPQIAYWIQEKLLFDGILPHKIIQPAIFDYQHQLPAHGCIAQFIEYINRLPQHHAKNLGAIVFAHWLLHLDQAICRRPTWLSELSQYQQSFNEAERCFWQNKKLSHINLDQECKEFFGYYLRENQKKIIEALIYNQTIPLGLLPTGGGKSLTFLLPALILSKYHRELTVIISPLKALMVDQVLGLKDIDGWGTRAAYLISGQSEKEQATILEGVWSGIIDILYISPERLRTHTILTLLSRRKPALWVIDEAHTVSQWGADFRPDFLRIGRLIAQCHQEKTVPYILLVTATASQHVINNINQEIIQPLQPLVNKPLKPVVLDTPTKVWRDNISAQFICLDHAQRLPEIRKILANIFAENQSNIERPVVLIYVRNRQKTEDFSHELAEQGFVTACYHGGMSATDKHIVLEKFKQYELDVVVCTNAFGMGIDRAHIHTVIHYSPPNNLESYLQEIGRAARKSNEKGHAILFWNELDLKNLVQLNLDSQLGGQKVLLECWQQVIAKVLKRPSHERWFTAQELQSFLVFEDEALITQIRVVLLALERYDLLVEKEQLPALLNLQLLSAPSVNYGQSTELYHQLNQLLIGQEKAQLYLPEISIALGKSVRQVLFGVRKLVKLGCAQWSCDVRIRLSYRKLALQRKFKEKQIALEALDTCWNTYPPEQIQKVDLKNLDQWLAHHDYRTKARDIFNILKYFKIIYIKENKYSLRLQSRIEDATWQTWLQHAKVFITSLQNSFNLLLTHLPDHNDTTHILSIDQITHQHHVDPDIFLQHLEILQQFGWLNVSRLDDEKQKIFFIDQLEHQRGKKINAKKAYEYLEHHYQDRNQRLHLLNHFFTQSLEHKKQLIEDYFTLTIDDVCKKYLQYPELAKHPHLQDYQSLIVPHYLNHIQTKIIEDDQRRATLILAGPGSGKTTIIVHRVAYLVMCKHIPAHKILILAYNRQAIFEIKQRLIALIGLEHTTKINVFTFHALARHLTNISENQAPLIYQQSDQKYQWLLEEAVRYLEDNPQFYQYILVDEFQDIDNTQYTLLAHLAGLRKTEDEQDNGDTYTQQGYLVAVGDDDQNLYGFRGANIQHIQNFKQEYQIKDEHILYLITNYRSPSDIVNLANQYIQQALPATSRLKTTSIQAHQIGHNNIRWICSQQQYAIDAIEWIVADINQNNYGDYAILAPQWKDLLVVQHYLQQANIPFQLLNQQRSLDPCDSMIGQKLLEHLRSRPALDLIEDATQYLEQWHQHHHWGNADRSWIYLKQRVQQHTQLTCEQLLQVLQYAKESTAHRVTLTTFHSAKGAEYPHVYLFDQPCMYQKDTDSHARAMYVALTRAQKTLTIIQTTLHSTLANALKQTINPVVAPRVANLKELQYYENPSLADIFLSHRCFVSEQGRQTIEKLARTPQYDINDLYLQDHGALFALESKTLGTLSMFSSKRSKEIKQLIQQKSAQIVPVALQILRYYQADLSFYQKAGYHGDRHDHFIVVPYLKISYSLV